MRILRFILIATFFIGSEIAAQNHALGIAENRDPNFTDPAQNDVFDLLSNTIFSSINIDNLSLVGALDLIQTSPQDESLPSETLLTPGNGTFERNDGSHE